MKKAVKSMLFVRALKEIKRNKSLAKIDFDDGETEIGFITYVDDETFDMCKMDTIFNQVILDEDFNGGIMLEREEDLESIDILFVKATFQTMLISSITHDISHKFEAKKTTYFNIIKEEIYKPKKPMEGSVKKIVKKNSVKNEKKKIIKKKDRDNIEEKN